MDHEQTMGVNSKVLDQKQQNVFDRISLFWSEPELQCNGGVSIGPYWRSAVTGKDGTMIGGLLLETSGPGFVYLSMDN